MSVRGNKLAVATSVVVFAAIMAAVALTGDGVIVLWQVAVFLVSMCIVLALGPWLTYAIQRRRGQAQVSWGTNALACFGGALLAGLFAPCLWLGALMLLGDALAATGGAGATGFAILLAFSLAASAVVATAAVRSILGPSGRLGGMLWSVALLMVCAGWTLDGCALRSLSRARELSKRPVDASRIRMVGMGLQLYFDEFAVYPQDLRQLVDAELSSGDALVVMHTKSTPPEHPELPYDGPCDFEYFLLSPEVPENLVWVWVHPLFNYGEGGHALFRSGQVEWLEADELQRRVAETRAWIEAHLGAVSTQPVQQQR